MAATHCTHLSFVNDATVSFSLTACNLISAAPDLADTSLWEMPHFAVAAGEDEKEGQMERMVVDSSFVGILLNYG